jgi:hypothetical protein
MPFLTFLRLTCNANPSIHGGKIAKPSCLSNPGFMELLRNRLFLGLFKNVQVLGAHKIKLRGIYRYALSGAVCSATRQMDVRVVPFKVFQQTFCLHQMSGN